METLNKLATSTQKWVLHSNHQDDIVLQGQLFVGRDSECDICIPDHRISRQHAKISVTPSGLVLEDLGSANGTIVNDQKISKPTLFKSGDKIKFHNMEFIAEFISPVKNEVLFLRSQDYADKELQGQLFVGRDPECDVCIPDHRISRKHAKITVTQLGVIVEDLNSINGTFVNDQKIDRATQVNLGDCLRFHENEFRIDKSFDPDATIICINVVDPDATICAGAIIKNPQANISEKINNNPAYAVKDNAPRQNPRHETNTKKMSAIQRQVYGSSNQQGDRVTALKLGMWVEFLDKRGKNETYCLISTGTPNDPSYSFIKRHGFTVVKKGSKRIDVELSKKSFRILKKGPLFGPIPSFVKGAITRALHLSTTKE
jgi:pSer/pThr/pTyr-binding forkhead associated (FHA) protein